jgi:hypothetical protein
VKGIVERHFGRSEIPIMDLRGQRLEPEGKRLWLRQGIASFGSIGNRSGRKSRSGTDQTALRVNQDLCSLRNQADEDRTTQ